MSNVSFYETVKKKSGIEVALPSLLEAIQKGRWEPLTTDYRSIQDEDEAKRFKTGRVPAFTVSGTFPDRRKAGQLESHSGFIAMDFDDVDDVPALFDALRTDPYTYALFRSISGNGLCAIVKIDGKRHKDAFMGLERYYLSQYSVGIDPACKDVSRCRFVSYDPDLVIRPESRQFSDYIPKPKGRKPKIVPTYSTSDDVEYVIRQIEAKQIDITSDYHVWVELAFAIHSEYGEAGEEYFQRVSQFHPDYDERKTAIKYRSARGGSGVTISTFFHHARQSGLQIVTPKTRTIQRAATYARKGGRKPDQVVKQLEEVDGIPPEESEEVVKKVFEADTPPELDDDIDTVGQIEDFLRRERRIEYNEVTLKYQEKDVPMVDRDMNSVYLDVKKVIPRASKDLVFSIIDSDRTPKVNPLTGFFKKYASRDPKSAIRTLAESIDTPTGLRGDNFCPEFAEIFIRKWLIGAVAMWHKDNSPLMLVLAGAKQNTGKSHFFRYLLPDELQPYYAEAELTGEKDENLLMCSKAIIMNDEMSNKSRRDLAVMKNLCSARWFNMRRPYGKSTEDLRRIAALAGTSNDVEILNDPTGNRRIIPIEVNAIDHDKYNSVDKIDLWMEAYHGWRGGEAYELNQDDIDLLNANTREFEEPSQEAELIMRYFRRPDRDEPGVAKMTNTDILAYLEDRSGLRNLSARKLGMELKKLGYKNPPETVDGQTRKLYRLVKTDEVSYA